MGKLMALAALVCTLAAAVLFQPALMGPPRRDNARMSREGESAESGARRPAGAGRQVFSISFEQRRSLLTKATKGFFCAAFNGLTLGRGGWSSH
jgi:hypothetical protein